MSAIDDITPIVSVCMVTYNHERFIAKAIEGVLMQETEFRVELVIGEDCSADGTRDIVVEYAGRYPDRIRPLLPGSNLGAGKNFVATQHACRGKYIALCEGDDYWTDPHKLQKQVDFLEAHPECSMCFHEAYDLLPDHSQRFFVRERAIELKPVYSLDDVVRRYFIPTASMLMRRDLIAQIPKEFYTSPGGDWFLHILLAQRGWLGFIDEPWSVYRWHVGGVMSCTSTNAQLRHSMDTAHAIDQYLNGAYADLLRPYVLNLLIELVAVEAAGALFENNQQSVRSVVHSTIKHHSNHLNLTRPEEEIVAGAVVQKMVYLSRSRGDWAVVRACWLASFRWPSHVEWKNRGFWSIGLTACLGHERSDKIRTTLRMLEGDHSR